MCIPIKVMDATLVDLDAFEYPILIALGLGVRANSSVCFLRLV